MNILERNNVHVQGKEGPALLYGHGFGCNQTMWDRITPAFADTHRQVLFDYVGCGQSDLACFDEQRYSVLQGYAQDLLDVYDALDLRSGVVFVGHSVSSTIGLLASIARPALFDRMILIGPSPCFLNHSQEYMGGFEREDLLELLSLMDQNYIGWADYLAPVVAGDGEAGKVTARLSDSFCSTDPVAARVFAEATFLSDHRADLQRVTRPCLILQHNKDVLAGINVGEYVHANLAGSTLQILDATGHCAHMSNPDLVIDAMKDYLQVEALDLLQR